MDKKVSARFYDRCRSGKVSISLLVCLFTLLPLLGDAQTFSVLYSFKAKGDGGYPNAGLVSDSAGNLYGSAHHGGPYLCAPFDTCGVIFKIDVSGKQTVLHAFRGPDGAYPSSIILHAGNIYGTSGQGGNYKQGVVFKLDSKDNETVLYSFRGGTDGGDPSGGVIIDADGNLYGTAGSGGAFGYGVVFKIDVNGNQSVLYSFTGGADGSGPGTRLVRDKSGNLYGTTNYGGSDFGGAGNGVIFRVDPNGNETVLYTFRGAADGRGPNDLLRVGGILYGTTYEDGAFGNGSAFKLSSTGKFTLLHSFQGGQDGALSGSGLIRDPAGNLYGMTSEGGGSGCHGVGCGTVFQRDNQGHERILHDFTGGADGALPFGELLRDTAGNLYGTTELGGGSNKGVVFKVTP